MFVEASARTQINCLVDIFVPCRTIETDRMQDNQVKRSTSPQPSYYGPKNSNYGVTIGGAARNRDVQKTQKSAEPNNWLSPDPPSFARAPSPQPSPKSSILDKLDPSAIPVCNVCNAPVRLVSKKSYFHLRSDGHDELRKCINKITKKKTKFKNKRSAIVVIENTTA